MVIGLLALTSIPTVIGVGQAVGAQNRQQAACKEQQKFNLTAMMPMDGELREAAFCVLVDNKVSFRPDSPHLGCARLTVRRIRSISSSPTNPLKGIYSTGTTSTTPVRSSTKASSAPSRTTRPC
jgi:hypothetical protein